MLPRPDPGSGVELSAFVSVDVETAGPNPSQYSLLAVGACTLVEPRRTLYVELQPVNDHITPEAFAVHGLGLEALRQRGLPPAEALAHCEAWLHEVVPAGQRPVFVAFNAPFDWMFVADYFHRYLGRNPFGHAALDIKAFYMGLAGVPWSQTAMRYLSPDRPLSHHALQDALDQADLFCRLLAESERRRMAADQGFLKTSGVR
jgi:DNA polymerase III epsilon subunit-like protein